MAVRVEQASVTVVHRDAHERVHVVRVGDDDPQGFEIAQRLAELVVVVDDEFLVV